MGTIACSQPTSKSSWDSQDFGDINMVLKMAHCRKSTGPRWVKLAEGIGLVHGVSNCLLQRSSIYHDLSCSKVRCTLKMENAKQLLGLRLQWISKLPCDLDLWAYVCCCPQWTGILHLVYLYSFRPARCVSLSQSCSLAHPWFIMGSVFRITSKWYNQLLYYQLINPNKLI